MIINKVVKNSEGTVLSSSEDATNFVFTITLTADDNHKGLVEGTKVYGDTVFKNGVGTVSLKAGGSTTISGIPEGLSYSVAERPVDGYDKTCDTDCYGVINEDRPGVVTYVNTVKPRQTSGGQGGSVADSFVNVTLKKIVTGNGEVEESCGFEIVLDNLKPDATYVLSNGTSFTADATGSANITLSLGNNQTVTVQNIPVGSKYKVFEHAGDYVSSDLITDSNDVGLIGNSANANTRVNTALATNTETADEGEDVTITFTNKKMVTQNLKLQKTVTDDKDTNSYIFNIEFANMEEGSAFNSTVGKVMADSNGKADLTIYLAGGESAEFYAVPVGTTYKITEFASGSIASYTVVDENNGTNIVSATNANTVAKKALSTEIETVNQGEEVTVTFTNDTVNQEPDSVSVSLGLSKTVVKPDGTALNECNEEFTFEIIANEDSFPMPENSEVKVIGNGDASFGTITFDKTGTYTYKVVEKARNNDNYIYDDTEYTLVYEVTNPEGLLEVSKSVKKNGFEADNIIFTNTLSRYDVAIFKADEDKKAIYGATLQIIDSEGNIIKEWMVSKNEINPSIIKLAIGTYTLHEVKAPEGYELADDIEFVVNDDGSVSVDGEVVVVVIMKDPKVEGNEPVDPSNPGEEPGDKPADEPAKPDDGKENQEDPSKQDDSKAENKDAVSEKTEEKPNKVKEIITNAQTGDKVMICIAVLAVAGIVLFISFRRKAGKH